LEHERRDKRAVNLDGHALGRFRHQVATAEDAFEPFEKQLDLPAVAVNQSDEFRLDFQIGGEQEVLAVHFHANHSDRLALPLVAEFDFTLPGNARRAVASVRSSSSTTSMRGLLRMRMTWEAPIFFNSPKNPYSSA
jgi:hypothetical protein